MNAIEDILREMRLGINTMRKCGAKPRKCDHWIVQLAIFADKIEEVWNRTVKHAKWAFIDYDRAVCTNCGEALATEFYSAQEAQDNWGELYNYCPYCGAKMDLD